MSVNGISSATNAYAAYNETAKTDTVSKTETDKTAADKTNSQTNKTDTYQKKASMSAAERKALVQKLKADSEKRMENFRELVEKMFLQQGKKFTDTDDMWQKRISPKTDTGALSRHRSVYLILHSHFQAVMRTKWKKCLRHLKKVSSRQLSHGDRTYLRFLRIHIMLSLRNLKIIRNHQMRSSSSIMY